MVACLVLPGDLSRLYPATSSKWESHEYQYYFIFIRQLSKTVKFSNKITLQKWLIDLVNVSKMYVKAKEDLSYYMKEAVLAFFPLPRRQLSSDWLSLVKAHSSSQCVGFLCSQSAVGVRKKHVMLSLRWHRDKSRTNWVREEHINGWQSERMGGKPQKKDQPKWMSWFWQVVYANKSWHISFNASWH